MDAVQTRRWTRDEYERMVAAGIFAPDDRVELIDGEVIAMTPQGSAHATAVSLASEALRQAFGSGVVIRAQLPFAVSGESEPEPDIAVVAGSPRDFRDAHPGSALLIVEVADATLAYDRGTKASLYARAGVPDFWILNLVESALEVYRDRVVNSGARLGWHYRTTERLGPMDQISPLTRPSVSIRIADLLP
jgi:Uma2 family endonuclease